MKSVNMSKRFVLTMLVSLSLLLGLIACSNGDTEENGDGTGNTDHNQAANESENMDRPESLQFPSGSQGGGFYHIAGVLGNAIESELDLPVSVMPSGGSGENINLMANGEAEITVVAANTLEPAYTGTGQYEGDPYDDFRLVMQLYENPTIFFALENSGLTHVNDLAGTRLGVGASPTAWDHLTGPILEAHGIAYTDDIDEVYVGFGDAATQVSDGQLDASAATVGMPALEELASQNDVVYLEWDEGAIDEIAEEYAYFNKVTVSGDELPGFDGEEQVVADIGGPYVVVHKDLPDEFVYELTQALYDNLTTMSESAPDLQPATENQEMLAAPLGDVPYHPGAEDFWKEQELWND